MWRTATTLLVILLAVLACDGEDGSDLVSSEPAQDLAQAPGEGTPDAPGPAVPSDSVPPPRPRGRALFERDCAGCHGRDGKGSGLNVRQLGKPALSPIGVDLAPSRILAALDDGMGAMSDPPWARMPSYALTYSSEERAALVAYLAELPRLEFPPEVNLSQGAEDRCQPCHASQGEDLIRQANCAGCHELPGFERRAVGPDLSGVGHRFREGWLFAYLGRPFNRRHLGYHALESNRMPDFRLTERERVDLTTFLSTRTSGGASGTPVDYPRLTDPSLRLVGEKLFRTKDCVACHEIGNFGGKIGPDLSGVALRLSDSWLAGWLVDPRRLDPETPMPTPILSDDERAALFAYLSEQKSDYPGVVNLASLDFGAEGRPERLLPLEGIDRFPPPASPEEEAGRIETGGRLFDELGCHGCHDLAGHEFERTGPVGPPLAVAGLVLTKDWFHDFVRDPKDLRPELAARMPRLGLTSAEVTSIYHTLARRAGDRAPDIAREIESYDSIPSARTPEPTRGREIFVERDCHSCHRVGDLEFGPVKSPYYQGSELERRKRFAPDLAFARRGRRGALHLQLRDPEALTPDARMPRIGLSETEIELLLDFLLERR